MFTELSSCSFLTADQHHDYSSVLRSCQIKLFFSLCSKIKLEQFFATKLDLNIRINLSLIHFWFKSCFKLKAFYRLQMEMQELLKFLLSSKDDKIEIVIGKMFRFHSYMRRFQVYKYVWSPLISEEHLK